MGTNDGLTGMTADTSQFYFGVDALPKDFFQVLQFNGSESVSECFYFNLQAISLEHQLNYEEVIGKTFMFTFYSHEGEIKRGGMVVSCEQYATLGDFSTYHLKLVPRIYKLSYRSNNRVFQKKSIAKIIEDVLTDAGFVKNLDFKQVLNPMPQEEEFVVQYNESDLNFIQRLMETHGIYYYFDHVDGKDVLMMVNVSADAPGLPEKAQLAFNPDGGMVKGDSASVKNLAKVHSYATGRYAFKDYNYRQPDSNVLGQSGDAEMGEWYEYASNLKDSQKASQLASVRQQMLDSGRTIFRGNSDCRWLFSGFHFELSGSGPSGFDGKYFITKIEHSGNQEAGLLGKGDSVTYSNTFECLSLETAYRPSLKTPKPQMNGILTAKVDGPDGPYAHLDEEGRYKVKFYFDRTDLQNGEASLPVRLAQPYTGKGYGMHFPVHKGTEILIAFENGDVDRPIGLATVPNPSNGTPVTSSNKSNNILKTASGHILQMNDLEDETSINLISSGKHSLSFQDIEKEQQIELKSAKEKVLLLDDKNEHITLKTKDGTKVMKFDDKDKYILLQTDYGHTVKMDDKKKVIDIQTKDKHCLSINDDKKTITLTDGNNKNSIYIDIGKNKIILTSEADMVLKAKNNLDIQATNIKMQSKGGTFDLSADQDINITSKTNVSAKGNMKMNLEAGMDLSAKGSLNLKLEGGVNVESKAGVASKTTGTLVNVEAKGLNTIKGAMVMIN